MTSILQKCGRLSSSNESQPSKRLCSTRFQAKRDAIAGSTKERADRIAALRKALREKQETRAQEEQRRAEAEENVLERFVELEQGYQEQEEQLVKMNEAEDEQIEEHRAWPNHAEKKMKEVDDAMLEELEMANDEVERELEVRQHANAAEAEFELLRSVENSQ